MEDFGGLGLHDAVARGFATLGFEKPTEVQAKAIPALLAGRDLLMESETGTGKTFAYLAPIFAALADAASPGRGVLALIAAPTQELAVQIGREAEKLAKASGIEAGIAILLGGSPIARQEAELKRGPRILVGTLGRLSDLAFARVLKLGSLRFLILDEADRLFAKETEELCGRLLEAVPRSAQRVLASATIPARVRSITAPWLRDPILVESTSTTVLSGDIEHWCFYCDSRKRLDFIRRFEASLRPSRCLLFHSNASRLGKLLETLESFGLPVAAISARRDKEERRVALERFAKGELRYLLTSDLGARGLDIAGISHVISLDLPEEPTVYIHRAGRTARAGAKGVSIVLADAVELKRASRLAVRGEFVFRTKVLREGKVFEPPVADFFALVEESEEQRQKARGARHEKDR
ncbi:MAG TPA: DEAD/DEAH box helicase [Rectinemataceae bacterium]|nr:DEAD/DEAH box helicase [Rectinemataceae bacterium]